MSSIKYKDGTYSQILGHPGGTATVKTTITNNKVKTKIRGMYIISAKTETEYQETLGLLNVTVSVRHDEGVCKYYYQVALKEDAVIKSKKNSKGGLGSAH